MKYPNISAEMARKGLTRTSLAKQLGVDRKTVYNWLSKGKIPMDAAIKLSEFFGCSLDYLLGRE